jgi:hypothetical protein
MIFMVRHHGISKVNSYYSNGCLSNRLTAERVLFRNRSPPESECDILSRLIQMGSIREQLKGK